VSKQVPLLSPNTSVLITYLGILELLLTFLTHLNILFLEGLQEHHSWPERRREGAPKMKQREKYITTIYSTS
jgi:hypothetical protein